MQRNILFTIIVLVCVASHPLFASAQAIAKPNESTTPVGVSIPDSPVGAQLKWFVDVLNGKGLEGIETHFGADFKSKIPPEIVARQLESVITSVLEGGPVVVVSINSTSTDDHIRGNLRSEANGVVLTYNIAVEPDTGLIALFSSQVLPGAGPGRAATWVALDAKFAELPGTTNFYAGQVAPDGTMTAIRVRNPDARLGIGSTFKLYVLGTLAEMVRDGETDWEQTLALREEWKSLPSGVMQTEEAGTEHPLAEFALKMISISDNTATDHLIHFIGRERVEAYMARYNADPDRSTPFLTTREIFAMKIGDDQSLAGRYVASDLAFRRAMLAPGGEVALAVPSMVAAAVWTAPMWIDAIEWFATGEECSRAIVAADLLAQLPGNAPAGAAMRANPGIGFDRSIWKAIAFKGGSEPGVLNLTWLVDRHDGARFVLSVGWNNPEAAVDQAAFIDLAGQAFGLLADAPAP